MLFTVLGLFALYLRERKQSGHHENDLTEDPSKRTSVNNPQTAVCATLKEGIDGVTQTAVCATSKEGIDGVPQNAVCATSQGIYEVFQTLTCATSKSDDLPPSFSTVRSKSTEDVLQAAARLTADPIADMLLSGQQLKYSRLTIDINSHLYEIGSKLGSGGFGSVFAATRLEDGLPVAIKFASNKNARFTSEAGHSQRVPMEIFLQSRVNQHPRVDEILQLLDWEVKRKYYFMVLERPMPCMALDDYVHDNEDLMSEDKARIIMHQATVAAQECCRRGVFHRDIKMENFLINPETLQVKLIDFGCGEPLVDTAYIFYFGTRAFRPPEFIRTNMYHGKPATVWSLGVLMFTVLFKRFPRNREIKNLNRKSQITQDLSEECINFLCSCLKIHPNLRIELEELSLHDWFKEPLISKTSGYPSSEISDERSSQCSSIDFTSSDVDSTAAVYAISRSSDEVSKDSSWPLLARIYGVQTACLG